MIPAPPPRFDPERWSPATAALGAVTLAAAVGLGGDPWLALLGGGLLALACWSRRDGFLLAGPFPKYELLRITRRHRVHLWRPLIAFLFAGLPALTLYYYLTVAEPPDRRTRPQAAVIASVGFLFLGWHVFLISVSLALHYLTNVVSEDRESKRQDFLLVTDLRGRELVVGKTLARLAGLVAYPLAVVPVVAALPLLFGVDPALILFAAGYAAATLFTVAGLSALGSVLAATKKAGGNWAVAIAAPYFLLTWVAGFLSGHPGIWFFPGSPTRPAAVSVGDVVEWASVGNPLSRFTAWLPAGVGGDLSGVARDFPAYAAFHVGAGLLLFALAAKLVRPVSGRLGEGKTAAAATTAGDRPPVSDRPVFWKEVWYHPLLTKARQHPTANRLAFVLLVPLPAAVFLAAAVSDLGGYAAGVRDVARYYPMGVAWLAVVSAGRFAMESVPRERERDTLTSLVLTPVPAAAIMRQKLLGVLWVFRWSVVSQLILAVPVVLTGAYTWWAFAGLLLLQLVFAFEMAAFGGWVGAGAARVEAASRAFALWFGGALVVLITVVMLLGGLAVGVKSPLRFGFVGLIPPLAIMAVGHPHLAPAGDLPYWAAGMLGGAALHAAVGWVLWRAAVRRFVRMCDPAREDGPLLTNREAKP